ncbi:MAG: exodeoxyribonuclease V subunit gamma [Desulfobacteraceae bacterium]|nr:exodeoxyribonuclease V subunit gamma [Desulfobacteraceae bacterium]
MVKSNKMEGLMDGLTTVLAQVPEDPLAPEWIGIQSGGMKQWITTQVTQKFGVCANLSFLSPRQMIERFFSGFGPRQGPLLGEDVLMWSIMEIILKNLDTPCFSGLKNYIAGDTSGRKLFQLSMKIAGIFDDYQIYRPRMLLDWEKGKGNGNTDDPVMAWQSSLWNQILASWPHTHMAARMAGFLKQAKLSFQGVAGKSRLPQRIFLFGVWGLPPGFLELFGALARTVDIYLFLLTPSNQGLKNEIANPLLASLGQPGIYLHSMLENFDYSEPLGDLFDDPLDHSSSMLSVLQSDIMNLVFRKAGSDNPPVTVGREDNSVAIHACHSPMREVQVLKDLLLDAFDKDQGLCPHEIIVMMPDIETYAPYLTAVFSSENFLPFSISDRRKKSESQTLEAFLKILELKDSRLEQARVLDLLLSPVIAAKFDVLPEDLLLIEARVREAGVLWGRDGSHRKELTHASFDENTWMFGFKRLFMGYGLAEGCEQLVAGVLPCDVFEGLEAQVLGKLAHFGYTLFDGLKGFCAPKTIPEWGESFKAVVLSMMEENHGNEADMSLLLQIINKFVRDGEIAEYARKIDFSVARDILEAKLDKTTAQGNFLTGSITFCKLMPMGSIPFKVVVLMGMGESSFPRKSTDTGFDLIKTYPQKGDKQEREEDRYLFLEAFLSARDRLIITYTGMSIKDNAPIPCSGVVEELKDVMAESFELLEGFVFHFHHPLHPFNSDYFDPNSSLFSFSRDQCKIAVSQALMEKEDGPPNKKEFLPRGFCLDRAKRIAPAKNMDQGKKSALVKDGDCQVKSLIDLVRFFRKPVETFVTQGLNFSFPEVEESAPDREVFQLSGLSRYTLGSYYMDKSPKNDLYSLVRAGGLLPFGQKGKSEWNRVKAVADPILALANTFDPGKPLPALGVDIQVDDFKITGSIGDLHEGGRFLAGFGRLGPGRLLTQWIYHLFLNALGRDGQVCSTRIIGQDPKGKLPAVAYSFAPVPEAQTHIQTLISLYRQGQDQVLPFFCDTSFYLAQSLSKNNYEQTRENLIFALAQSKRFWFDRFYGGGESCDRYVELMFGHNDPFENLENLIESGIVDNALLVYQPLLENLTCP